MNEIFVSKKSKLFSNMRIDKSNSLVYNYITKINCLIGGNLLFLALFNFNNK